MPSSATQPGRSTPAERAARSRLERRQTPRQRTEIVASVAPSGGASAGRYVQVLVQNLSEQGIGFLHVRPFRVGERLVARLPADGSRLGANVLCTVVHCQPLPDGTFAIGASFFRMVGLRVADPFHRPAR